MARARVNAPGMRQIVFVVACALGLMAAVVSSSLIVLTTSLHDESQVLRELGPWSPTGARDAGGPAPARAKLGPGGDRRLKSKVRQTLTTDFGYPARDSVTRATREHAKDHVERYLAMSDADSSSVTGNSSLDSALDALEPVVHRNILEADRALARSSRLDG